MESRRKRVEQKGRFTITEIIPGSPNSPTRLASPTFQDDAVSKADFPTTDDVPTSNGSNTQVVTVQPTPALQPTLTTQKIVEIHEAATNGALEPALKTEEPPETHTQPPETVSVPPAPIEAGPASVPHVETAAAEPFSEASTATAGAAACRLEMGSPTRKYSSPKKSREGVQRARRVKRRGRFTIIELASDSPTSRKNADDLYDHRFVTTTSIGASSTESAPQLGTELSRSFDNIERRTKPKRVTRSMPRLRQSSSVRRSRRRSESPDREFAEYMDMVDPRGNQQQQQDAAAYAKLQALPVVESTDAAVFNNVVHATAIAATSAATMNASTCVPVSLSGVTIPETESTVAVTPTSVRPPTPSSQLMKVPDNNGSVVSLPQTSITISAGQFMQQQQTISSLIRQQHDLKQIINVLQEQQQQLMSIPSQINELKRQRASLNNGETRDDEMRELYLQVDTLTRANESLHSLLNAAEREARHRTLEIECLSEENDELRHRYGKLESRYMDERKQSFVLEEELQRLRMLSLTQQEQQLRQQQNRRVGSSQTSVAVE